MPSSKLPKETQLEKISGSPATSSAMALISAFSGTPLAALLPVLTETLAGGRHKARVETAIAEMSEILQRHEKKLKQVSDSQYKIINEMILAVFQTTEQAKLNYLRNVLSNAITANDVTTQQADFISRVVRDMSASEAEFLVDNFRHPRVHLTNLDGDNPNENALTVKPASADGITVTGLISLGLLIPAEATWDESGLLRWSTIVEPLIALLGESRS